MRVKTSREVELELVIIRAAIALRNGAESATVIAEKLEKALHEKE